MKYIGSQIPCGQAERLQGLQEAPPLQEIDGPE